MNSDRRDTEIDTKEIDRGLSGSTEGKDEIKSENLAIAFSF